MKKNLIHQPIFRLVVPPIYGIMMDMLILLLNNSLAQLDDTVFTTELLVCVILAYLISEPLRLIIRGFERKSDDGLRSSSTIAALLVTNLLVGSLIILLAAYSYFTYYEGYIYEAILTKMVIVYGISGLLFTMFFLSTHFLSVKNESEYLNNVNLYRSENGQSVIDNSLKPSWAELEAVFNETLANGFGGEIIIPEIKQIEKIIDQREVPTSASLIINPVNDLPELTGEKYNFADG